MIPTIFVGFDAINLLVLASAVFSFAYGFLVYVRNRDVPGNLAFVAFTFTVGFWAITMVVYRSPLLAEHIVFSARLLYVAAVLITPAFVLFARLFESTERPKWYWYAIVGVPTAIMMALSILPDALIQNVTRSGNAEPVILFDPTIHLIYFVNIMLFGVYGYAVLLQKYLRVSTEEKKKMFYVMIGTFIPLVVSTVSNLFLPSMGIFDFNWVGQVSTFATTSIITYGIFRQNIFDVRVIASEFMMFALWGVSFVRITLSQNVSEFLLNTVVFVIFVPIGILLIKATTKEVKRREEAERISQERSELMAFASHELRNPVTAIRGYSSLILDPGMDMDAGPRTKDIVQNIYSSSSDMIRLIAQFLNKSKLELGQIEYTISEFDTSTVLFSVVEGFKPIARQKGIEVMNKIDLTHKYMIRADDSKLRENVGDLIDNAIKYTKQGTVTVSIERVGVHVRIVVADTGVGIAEHTMPHLFKKFSRADAQKANLLGTGVGLYIAKTLIEGSGGKIWAESEGDGKGSRFIVEYPAV